MAEETLSSTPTLEEQPFIGPVQNKSALPKAGLDEILSGGEFIGPVQQEQALPPLIPFDSTPEEQTTTNQIVEETTKAPVTTQTLQETTEITPAQPAPTPAPVVAPAPTPQEAAPDLFKLTESELEQGVLSDEIRKLTLESLGEEEFRKQQEETQDIAGKRTVVQNISNRIKALEAEQAQIPLQLQEESRGRGITAAGLRPLQTARLRTNAIALLGANASFQAASGNLSLAQDFVDRAVAAEFEPKRAEIAAKLANLEILRADPKTSFQDKKRAMAVEKQLRREEAEIASQEEQKKEIFDIMKQAAFEQADDETLRNIQNSTSTEDALRWATPFLGRTERDQVEFERSIDLANLSLNQQKLALERRKTESQLEQTRLDIQAKQAELGALSGGAADEQKIDLLTSKFDLISGILDHSAFNSTVGPNPLARMGPIDSLSGGRISFIADVEQLVSQETLAQLISVKADGATFGALSDGEREELRRAATKIGTWQIKDDDGQVTGYKVSQDDFAKEITRLQEITQKALINEGVFLNLEDEDLAEVGSITGAGGGPASDEQLLSFYQ